MSRQPNLGVAHVDGDAVDARHADVEHAGLGLELQRLAAGLLRHHPADAAHAVAAGLGLRAVGIVDADVGFGARRLRRRAAPSSGRSASAAARRWRAPPPRVNTLSLPAQVDHHDLVAEAVHLAEGNAGRHAPLYGRAGAQAQSCAGRWRKVEQQRPLKRCSRSAHQLDASLEQPDAPMRARCPAGCSLACSLSPRPSRPRSPRRRPPRPSRPSRSRPSPRAWCTLGPGVPARRPAAGHRAARAHAHRRQGRQAVGAAAGRARRSTPAARAGCSTCALSPDFAASGLVYLLLRRAARRRQERHQRRARPSSSPRATAAGSRTCR